MKSKLNLVITGLPRSGTSLLCARVNDFKNAVVLNEPAEVFGALRGGSVEGLLSIFSQYRDDIEQGKPVANKIKNGKFIEDTRLEDSRSLYVHPIDDSQFTLGIKNTLVFMAMLSEITRAKGLPKVVASIRHPYDCIASWHSVAFPHLQQAKPDFLLNYATGNFSDRLPDLLNEQDLYVRSAKLWLLLAKTLLVAKSKIHVVRYEDMVKKPEREYERISQYLGLKMNVEQSLSASMPVRRREEFSDAQRGAIAEVCNKVAGQFGYQMN